MTIKEIDKIQWEYESKLDKWEQIYQETGVGKTETRYRYQDIINLCILARQSLEETCSNCKKTRRNIEALLSKYKSAAERDRYATFFAQNVISDVEYINYSLLGFNREENK